MQRFTLLWITLIAIFFSDCSYQKRVYRKGYYIDWYSSLISKKSASKLINYSTDYVALSLKSNTFNLSDTKNYTPTVQSPLSCYPALSVKKQTHWMPEDSCGDRIILKTGDDYYVKVTDITDEVIKYKRCDNPDGPLYSINKAKVYSIVYRNGYREYFSSDANTSKTNKNNTSPRGKRLPEVLVFTTIMMVLFSMYMIPVIPFLARAAKRKIRQYPEQYTGAKWAGCLMIGGLVVLFALLFILFVFAISEWGYLFYLSPGGALFIVLMLLILIPLVLFFITSKKEDFR